MTRAVPTVLIDHVDTRRRFVSAFVTTGTGKTHRLGYLPTEGWFCTCARARSCAQIKHVKTLVPPMEEEARHE